MRRKICLSLSVKRGNKAFEGKEGAENRQSFCRRLNQSSASGQSLTKAWRECDRPLCRFHHCFLRQARDAAKDKPAAY